MHDDNGGVAQGGGNSPVNMLTDIQSWLKASAFETGHPCCGQLTPVKTMYHVTILWAQAQ